MHLLRLFILALAIGTSCPASAMDSAAGVPPQERPLVIGYSSKVFFEVDPRDAIGLTKVWAQAADRAIRDMYQDAKGRQLLTLFRINRLVDFRAEHLVSVDKVIKENRAGSSNQSGRKH